MILSILSTLTCTRIILRCLIILTLIAMINANLYTTLGLITSHFNEKQLKAAYRSSAIRTHPDKIKKSTLTNNDDGLEFQQVSEAFKILKGKQRSEDTIEEVHVNLFNLLTQGPNIVVQASRKTKISCKACLGTGSPNGLPVPKLCTTCRGSGQSTQTWGCRNGQPCIHMSGTCGTCGGQGWIGQLCRICRGSGCVQEQRDFTVEFPTGSLNEHTLRAVGEGDIQGDCKYNRPGDLLFKLRVVPHPIYALIENTNDLKTTMEMNVEKLRTTFDMNVERLGGARQGYVQFKVPAYRSMVAGETRTVRIENFTDYGDLVLYMKAREDVWSFNT